MAQVLRTAAPSREPQVPAFDEVNVKSLKWILRKRGVRFVGNAKKSLLYDLAYPKPGEPGEPKNKFAHYTIDMIKAALKRRGVEFKGTHKKYELLTLLEESDDTPEIPVKLILPTDLKEFCSVHHTTDLESLNFVLKAKGYRVEVSEEFTNRSVPPLVLPSEEKSSDYTLSDLRSFLTAFRGEGERKGESSRSDLLLELESYYTDTFVRTPVVGSTLLAQVPDGIRVVYFGNRRFYRPIPVSEVQRDKYSRRQLRDLDAAL